MATMEISSILNLDISSLGSLLCMITDNDCRNMKLTCKFLNQVIASNTFLRAKCYISMSHCAAANDLAGFDYLMKTRKFELANIVNAIPICPSSEFIKLTVSHGIYSGEAVLRAAFLGDLELLNELHCMAGKQCEMNYAEESHDSQHELHPLIQGYFKPCLCYCDNMIHYVPYENTLERMFNAEKKPIPRINRISPIAIIAAGKSHSHIIKYLIEQRVVILNDFRRLIVYFIAQNDYNALNVVYECDDNSFFVLDDLISAMHYNHPLCFREIYNACHAFVNGTEKALLCQIAIESCHECIDIIFSKWNDPLSLCSISYYMPNTPIDCIISLHKNGCKWDAHELILIALESHNIELLSYVSANDSVRRDYDYSEYLNVTSDECRELMVSILGMN